MAQGIQARGLAARGTFVALALLAACAARVAADHPSLLACLESEGVFTLSGADDEYFTARLVFSKLFENWPAAIAYPESTEQVAAAVRCARKFRVAVHPRCGGHGNEGESVVTGALTLDLTLMNEVKLLGRDGGTARVQGGVHAGTVIAELWKQSNGTRGFPAGQRPVVGVSGYSLGGGFGALTRLAGLGGDNIISVKGVDGRGRILTADAKQNSALLWAARGGGGGRFAIITEFVFRTVDVSGVMTDVEANIPPELAADALEWFQVWQNTLPDRLTLKASYTTEPESNNVTVYIHGLCVGSADTCRKAVEKRLPDDGPLAGALRFTYKEDSYLNIAVNGIGWPVPNGYTPEDALADPAAWNLERSYYKYKSVILKKPLSPAGIQAVLDFANKGPRNTRVFGFEGQGGAVARVPGDATAAANLRKAGTVLVMRANSKDKEEANRALQDATAVLEQLTEEVRPYRGYLNFLDTDVLAASTSWVEAFYGPAADGLLCVARKYDPDNTFALVMDVDRVKPPSSERCASLLRSVGSAAAAWSRELERNAPVGV